MGNKTMSEGLTYNEILVERERMDSIEMDYSDAELKDNWTDRSEYDENGEPNE